MKTLRCIALASLALCASFIISTPASAQKGSTPQALGMCMPDCFSDNFVLQPSVILTLPGGCQVKVDYGKRLACGVWHDLQIIKITPLTIGCGIFTPAQILDFTTLALIQANPMGFPPTNPGDCNTNWRVSRASCWKFDSEDPTGEGFGAYYPCDQNVCCLQAYRVCLDENGNRIITRLPSPPPPQDCPIQVDPNAVCYLVCD